MARSRFRREPPGSRRLNCDVAPVAADCTQPGRESELVGVDILVGSQHVEFGKPSDACVFEAGPTVLIESVVVADRE